MWPRIRTVIVFLFIDNLLGVYLTESKLCIEYIYIWICVYTCNWCFVATRAPSNNVNIVLSSTDCVYMFDMYTLNGNRNRNANTKVKCIPHIANQIKCKLIVVVNWTLICCRSKGAIIFLCCLRLDFCLSLGVLKIRLVKHCDHGWLSGRAA